MADDNAHLSTISKAGSLEEIGEFWDTHDFCDFDDMDRPDSEFQVRCSVPVEPTLLGRVEERARRSGISVETLINLWLQQKLVEST